MQVLSASSYAGISDRVKDVDRVKKALDEIIHAQPTQIHPDERERYLDALLGDLRAEAGAVWTHWPEDLHLHALTALKTLGRNPIGSTTLLTGPHLSTLLFHTALPLPSSPPDASQTPLAPPARNSPPALEALRALANVLVLHPAGRNRFARAGGAVAVAVAMAGKTFGSRSPENHEGEENVARLFLLGRIGFLVTLERKEAVKVMVDEEGVIQSLAHHLSSVQPVPANFDTLSELLKLGNNLLRFYPFERSSTAAAIDDWDDHFEPLLAPTLALLHRLAFTDLVPPLSHTIHLLLSIPFLPSLLSKWHAVPETPSSQPSSARKILTKLGNMTIGNPLDTSASASASAPEGSRATTSSSASATSTRIDTAALPTRLLGVLEGFCETYLPEKKDPDAVDEALVLDEHLPPLLLLMARAADGSEAIRKHLREVLIPVNLDRTPEAGPLEKRDSLLGHVLRLMSCAKHFQTRDSAGEMMWAICDGDASTLTAEIGYGNSAGVLFRKGISGPPPGKIQELPSTSTSTSPPRHRVPAQPASSVSSASGSRPASGPLKSVPAEARHPITSLEEVPDPNEALQSMTQEEKEREAERLFVLFDRLERNPVISTVGEDGRKKGMRDVMRERMQSGEVDGREREAEERERIEREDEERKEEEEVAREMAEYKRRMGRSK